MYILKTRINYKISIGSFSYPKLCWQRKKWPLGTADIYWVQIVVLPNLLALLHLSETKLTPFFDAFNPKCLSVRTLAPGHRHKIGLRSGTGYSKDLLPELWCEYLEKGVFALVANANYVVHGQHTREPSTIVKGEFRGGAEGAAAPYFSNIFKAVL